MMTLLYYGLNLEERLDSAGDEDLRHRDDPRSAIYISPTQLRNGYLLYERGIGSGCFVLDSLTPAAKPTVFFRRLLPESVVAEGVEAIRPAAIKFPTVFFHCSFLE